MSKKTAIQKQARARHRARQKQLMEVGRKSMSLLMHVERQAIESSGRAAQLEGLLHDARKQLGHVTSELGEVRAAKDLVNTVLDGSRSELTMASEEVARLNTELSELTAKHQATLKELAVIKAADSDAKSLRTRLAHKSEEIILMRGKLQVALNDLRAEKAKTGISFDATKKDDEETTSP